jgi:hypothetical protein
LFCCVAVRYRLGTTASKAAAMKIALRYPVKARAKNGAGQKVIGFGHLVGEFEIRSASAASHPFAIEFRSGKRGDVPVRFRFDPESGQLFRQAGSVKSAIEGGSFYYGTESNLAYTLRFQSLNAEYHTLKNAGARVEPGMEGGKWFSSQGTLFAGDGLASVNRTDLDECLGSMTEYLADYVVVDGIVWEPCPEPLLTVQKGTDTWNIHLGFNEYYGPDWHTYKFSVDEFELANRWIDTLCDQVQIRPRMPAEIVVDPQYRVVRSGAVADVRALAWRVLDKVSTAKPNLAWQSPEVIEEFAALKRIATQLDGEVCDDLASSAVHIMTRLCERDAAGEIEYADPGAPRGRNYTLAQLRRTVDLHAERWNNRPINVVGWDPSPL